jgi:hypothetical protein
MTKNETELKKADQLDRVVENIIQGDRGLFEGVPARWLSHDTMEVVDLATFVMPLEVAEGKEFERRMCLAAAREIGRLASAHDPGPRKAQAVWSRLVGPIHEVGLAVAAFCAAFFLEPMAGDHEGRSIDTLSRPWYNVAMGKYLVGSGDSQVGRLPCTGSSGARFGYRVAVCR